MNEMIDNYCKDENTLVLLVVAGKSNALSSNQAVDKVTRLNKRAKTVLCLTMCDRVPVPSEGDSVGNKKRAIENLHYEVVDRILMNSLVATNNGDNPRLPGTKFGELSVMKDGTSSFIPFHSCVAVANLDFPEDDAEKKYFDGVIANLDPSLVEHKVMLLNHFTCAAVLRELDKLYHNHMKKDWCPKVTKQINEMISADTRELNLLGTPPPKLTPRAVWDHIISKLDKNLIQTSIHSAIDAACARHSFTGNGPMSLPHTEDFRKVEAAISTLLNLQRKTLADTMFAHFQKIFKDQEDKTLMIDRFEHFAKRISEKILSMFNDRGFVSRDKKRLNKAADHCIQCVHSNNIQVNWTNFKTSVKVYYAATALDVLDSIATSFNVDAEDDQQPLLREKTDIASKRKSLVDNLARLNDQLDKIIRFDNFLK